MRARKVDANHSAIRDTIREAGISVFDLSSQGRGIADFICGYGGRTFLVEVKDGAKSPSRRKLTAAQADFKAHWQGHYVVLETVEQARLWAIAITKKV